MTGSDMIPSVDRGRLHYNAEHRRWQFLGSMSGTLRTLELGDMIFIEVGHSGLRLTLIWHSGERGWHSVDGYELREGLDVALPTE
jgi:hypothetical protein